MRARQGHKVVKLLAARQFILQNADRLPQTCSCPALQEFDELLFDLRNSYEGQEKHRFGGMSETQRYHALRKVLIVEHIEPVVLVARLRLRETPELAPFTMPRGNPSAVKLAAFAQGMAKAAKPYADVFVAAGLESDFDTRLTEAAEAMVDSSVQRRMQKAGRTMSTHGIDGGLRTATDILRLLTVFVRRDAADHTTVLEEWRTLAQPRTPKRLPSPTMKALPSTTESLDTEAHASSRLLANGIAETTARDTSTSALPSRFLGGVSRLLRQSRSPNSGSTNETA